jgi:hypothetical protein
MSLNLTFDFEDAQLLYEVAMSSRYFVEDGAMRFSPAQDDTLLIEMLFSSPAFQTGSLLWTKNAADGLLLTKIHRAAGHEAHLLFDQAADNENDLEFYAVLTSWNIEENRNRPSDFGELLIPVPNGTNEHSLLHDVLNLLGEENFKVSSSELKDGLISVILEESTPRRIEARDILAERLSMTIGTRTI